MFIKKFDNFNYRKINEIFDDFDIKSMNELEYLIKGKDEFLKDFKEIEHLYDQNTIKFSERLTSDFPILRYFHFDEFRGALIFYATSFEKVGDVDHYANLTILYDDNMFQMASLFRELENTEDKSRWLRSEKITNKYEDARKFVSNFLDMCIYYNIIHKSDKNNPGYN